MHAKNCTDKFYLLKEQIELLEADLMILKSPLLIGVAQDHLAALYEQMDDVVMEAEGFVAYD